MRKLIDQVELVRNLLLEEPALESVAETRMKVTALRKSLSAFAEVADQAKLKLHPDYLELVAIIRKKKISKEQFAKACKEVGVSAPKTGGAKGQEKVAMVAMEKGVAVPLSKALGKSPDEVLQDQFYDLALLGNEEEILKGFKRMSAGKKLEPLASVVGFEIGYKIAKSGKNKGKKSVDSALTFKNAYAKLRPYLASLKDVG